MGVVVHLTLAERMVVVMVEFPPMVAPVVEADLMEVVITLPTIQMALLTSHTVRRFPPLRFIPQFYTYAMIQPALPSHIRAMGTESRHLARATDFSHLKAQAAAAAHRLTALQQVQHVIITTPTGHSLSVATASI
jgi:hypothetical protein